jgi:hypothetical protein
MSRPIHIQFQQFYSFEQVSRIKCYPNNLQTLGDERFDFSESFLSEIDDESRLVMKQLIHLADFGFKTYWFDGEPFMVEKVDRFRETPNKFWITNLEAYYTAYGYLKTKHANQYPVMENGRVVKLTDKILPISLDINDEDSAKYFNVKPLVKKLGVMAIGASGIIPGTKYFEYLVFVSENTTPITKVICRRGTFMRWVKTYTADELNAINTRILQPLVWKHGNTRDVHLYMEVCENPHITDFDYV